jgi:AbrB family looped-hinge helix DNA binding protein
MKTVVSERGQITVPKEVRDQLALTPGTELEVEIVRGGFMVRKRITTSPWREVLGVLGKHGRTDPIMAELRGEADEVD